MEKVSDFAILVKLIAFLSVMLIAFIAKGSSNLPFIFIVALLYLLAQRKYAPCIKYLLFYAFLWFVLFCITEYKYRMLLFSEFHLFLFLWLTPIFMISYDLISSPPGQISSFLSKVNAPTAVILGVLVIFRFFPTMASEVRALKESMHNRGLLALKQTILHPLLTFEYMIVPIMMRCVQIADQLTISALSRGIEAPVKRSSYYDKAMTIKDYCCIVFWILNVAAFLIMRDRV